MATMRPKLCYNSAAKLAFLSLFLGHREANGFSMPSGLISRAIDTADSLSRRSRVVVNTASYGRGAEIWPECNEDPLQLADSFPNGVVPPSAIMAMDQADMDAVHNRVKEAVDDTGKQSSSSDGTTESTQRSWSKRITRILRRAAAKEELEFEEVHASMDKTPTVVALGLLLRGLIRPLDVVVVGVLTAYFVILHMAARSPRGDDVGAPTLPALPPQGHVPIMVSNPMGQSFTYSNAYDTWLKLGVLTGLFGPILYLTRLTVKKEMVAARICARPIFLLCCQAISEAFSRRVMVRSIRTLLIPFLDLMSCSVESFSFFSATYPILLLLSFSRATCECCQTCNRRRFLSVF